MFVCSYLLLASLNTMSISSLDTLDDHAFKQRVRVTVSGQVVLTQKNQILLRDSTGYVVICDTNRIWSAGDWCLVSGTTRLAWSDQRVVDATESQFLRHTPPPPPISATLSEAASGAHDNQVITVSGVVTAVLHDDIDSEWNWLILKSAAATLPVAISMRHPWEVAPDDLVDAEIAVTGVCLPNAATMRRYLGSRIEQWDPGKLTILKPSPDDPFSGTRLTNITPGSLHDVRGIIHRVVVRGVVTAVWGNGRFFVRTQDGKSIQAGVIRRQKPPAPGVSVVLSGFVEHDPYFLRLEGSVWKVDASAKPPAHPEAIEIDPAKILQDDKGNRQIDTTLHGKLVRFQGQVTGHLSPQKCSLDTKGGPVTLELGSNLSSSRLPPVGAYVSSDGILKVEFDGDYYNTPFPLLSGISIVTRSNDDITVLSSPPWWTPVRLVIAIAILLALLVVILFWNFSLRILVTKKSRSLLKEQAAKIEETLKIDERTRLAAELHDYLAQNLTVVSYQISAAESALREGRCDTARFIENADKMLQSCRTDLRRCLWDLKSDALGENDFSKAILKTTALVAGEASVSVRFDIRRTRLSDSTAHAILSICRELVSNAVQHGQAKTVRIAGEMKDGAIRFSVRDDGCGFDPSHREGPSKGHFGLSGVNERVRRLGGQFVLQSSPGKGTRVLITLHNGGNK